MSTSGITPGNAIAEMNRYQIADSPAFDINPSVDKADHVLNIDDIDNRPSSKLVESTATFYRLTAQSSQRIIAEVLSATKQWQATARRAGISSIEIAETSSAFSAISSAA
jgi:serine/threonine-protein kinase HipA